MQARRSQEYMSGWAEWFCSEGQKGCAGERHRPHSLECGWSREEAAAWPKSPELVMVKEGGRSEGEEKVAAGWYLVRVSGMGKRCGTGGAQR